MEAEAVAFSINKQIVLFSEDKDTLVRLLTDEEYIMEYILRATINGDLKQYGFTPDMASNLEIILLDDTVQVKYAPQALAAANLIRNRNKPMNNNVDLDTSTELTTLAQEMGVSSCEPSSPEMRTQWTRNEILKLISVYEENQATYKSTTVRKDQFWQMAANKLDSGKTPTQCQNKFKYLCQMYKKKKDNMSAKKTGEAKINFPYFDEMDAIFGNDHNVTPVAVASSSNNAFPNAMGSPSNNAFPDAEEGEMNEPPTKKVKASTKGNKVVKILLEREKNTERRHQENLEKKNEALELCRQLIQIAKQCEEKK